VVCLARSLFLSVFVLGGLSVEGHTSMTQTIRQMIGYLRRKCFDKDKAGQDRITCSRSTGGEV